MIKETIYEYWDKELPEVFPREVETDSSDLINDVVGIRRCGKTFMMFSKIRELLKKVNKKIQKEIIDIAKKINKENLKETLSELDKKVYKLYEITKTEQNKINFALKQIMSKKSLW